MNDWIYCEFVVAGGGVHLIVPLVTEETLDPFAMQRRCARIAELTMRATKLLHPSFPFSFERA